MVADAVHSFSDLATDVVVIVFARISAKPRDDGHDYGHGKYETLATILISMALGVVGRRNPRQQHRAVRSVLDGGVLPRPGLVALVAAVLSIAAKEILYRYTVREGRAIDSPSVVANAWHHRSDALSSLGTLVGIGCAYFLGDKWRIADPIAALIVAVFIFKVAFDLIRTGVGELLEKSLPRRDGAGDPAHRNARSRRRAAAQPPHAAYRRRYRHRDSRPRRWGDDRRALPCLDGRNRTPPAECFGEGTMIAVHVEPLK